MENLLPQDFPEDFEFLMELKARIIEEIRKVKTNRECAEEFDKYANGVNGTLSGDRKIRIVFPQSLDDTVSRLTTDLQEKTDPLMFVGFIGYAKEVSQELIDQVWDNDRELIPAMGTHRDILCYASAEREAGGDWGNLVVFANDEALQHWKDVKVHKESVCEISPKYYTHLRIHRGALPDGLPSEKFTLYRTLYLDYTNSLTKRLVKYWKDESLKESELAPISVTIA